ncbi:ABC transporter ATP-binding protein [Roseomonas sp. AR75]|uniref:ABC transporter ATP-binding protein n=1 Tax=Roseomonas sp. AR75 TaxID=2562311 RepID=UPI00197EA38B|nr:ABC transporter ATP-binding protein [Roseomonas sp. AR75]
MVEPLLTAADVSAGYGGRMIVEGVSLRVAPGEVLCLLGHNGAGKSTLLRAFFGLLPGRTGHVAVEGRSLDGLAPRQVLLAGLAYVPQERSVFPKLTVRENLRMGGYALGDAALLARRMEQALDLFPRLRERVGQLAGTLSGGEQRMLEVARTLLLDPRVVMLDEPSIGLAPRLAEQVFSTIRDLAVQRRGVLLVEQSVKRALAVSDRAVVMEMGRIVLEDSAAALASDDRVAKLYMGAAGKAFGGQ